MIFHLSGGASGLSAWPGVLRAGPPTAGNLHFVLGDCVPTEFRWPCATPAQEIQIDQTLVFKATQKPPSQPR
jgi:hypothetical protein